MRNSKAKQIRRVSKRINNNMVTKYNVGTPPYYNNMGYKVVFGVPTTINKDCHRFVYKKLKNGSK